MLSRLLRTLLALAALITLGLGASWAFNRPSADIRGIWKAEGYGLYVDIGHTAIDVYEVTQVSCQQAMQIPGHLWLVKALEDITFSSESGRLRIDAGGTVAPIMADPVSALPAPCPETPAGPGSAQDNFDVLWQAMEEHYAFFDLHGVDWAERRDAFRPADDAVLDDGELFELFKQTLDGLDDGHLSIRTPNGEIHSPSLRPDWNDDRHLVRDATLAQFSNLTPVDNTGLLYGWATPEIGYIYMAHMSTNGGFNIKEADLAREGFREIAASFADAEGIIIDVRYNPGGSDDVALAYASHFTDQTIPAFTKSTRTETGYTAPFAATVPPAEDVYLSQPVILLTTGFTGSGAEIFTMAMRELPQVTVLGTNTSGALSDIGDFTLPNGWSLGLSHQRYIAPDGQLYEGVGVPPDILIDVDVEAARNGDDNLLQAAIEQLSTR